MSLYKISDFFWSLLRLPKKPVALPSREFSTLHNDDTYTWEDFFDDIKKKYPIRYFLVEQALDFVLYGIVLRTWRPIDRFFYWLASHLIPSRRHHMLDLRQPKSSQNNYRWGWAEISERILFANFNLLNLFVKDELSLLYLPTEEEAKAEKYYADQRATILEINELHNWWNIQREFDWKSYNQKLIEYNHEELLSINEMEMNLHKRDEEMLIRLMRIRLSLWS